jgi:hypothetical protein
LLINLAFIVALLNKRFFLLVGEFLPAFSSYFGEFCHTVSRERFGNAGLLLFEEVKEAGGGSLGLVTNSLSFFPSLIFSRTIFNIFTDLLRLLLFLNLLRTVDFDLIHFQLF